MDLFGMLENILNIKYSCMHILVKWYVKKKKITQNHRLKDVAFQSMFELLSSNIIINIINNQI